MKNYLLILFLCIKVVSGYSQKITSPINPDSILTEVFQKLKNIKSIEYLSSRELNYSSENYRNLSSWNVYVDLQSKDKLIGFRYQIDDSLSKQFFNGTEFFQLDLQQKTIKINEHPTIENLSGHSALYNSIITLKNILPQLITNKTITKEIKDTLINKKNYSVVSVNTGQLRIQNLGLGYDTLKSGRNFIYKLIIDRNTNLPIEIIQGNDLNKDFIKTTFANIKGNLNIRPELTWYYSTYSTEYSKLEQKNIEPLLSKGKLASEWTLKTYNRREFISLSSLKGKIVLLDFWIKNCGPCIESVPHLNELQARYKNRNFKLISINAYDSPEDIEWFCKRNKVNYTTLIDGKSVAEKYGVSGYPTVFLIDKDGKILYSGAGFNQLEIEKLIKTHL